MHQKKNVKKSLKKYFKLITTKSFLFLVYYYANYSILSTVNQLLDRHMSLRAYTLPLMIIYIISFFTKFAFKVSKRFYWLIYYASSFFIGLDIQFFWIISTYKFLSIFITFPKKISLFICIVLPIILSLYASYKARVVYIKNIKIKVKKKLKNKLTICHLSDIHLGVLYRKKFAENIVNLIKQNVTPDVIAITGDLFDNNFKPNIEWLEPFKSLSSDIPILYVTGNHESLIGKRIILDIIRQTNINCIGEDPECVTIKENFDFYGINHDFDFIKKISSFKLSNDNDKVNILLGHCPIFTPKILGKLKFDIYLAGHTHGGQMFPLHLIDYMINKSFSGLYEQDGKWVYVSPGLGTVVFPMRLYSDSTIGVITVEGE